MNNEQTLQQICPRRITAPPRRAFKSGARAHKKGGMYHKTLRSLESSTTSIYDRRRESPAEVSSSHKHVGILRPRSISSFGLPCPMQRLSWKTQSHHFRWKTSSFQLFPIKATLQHLRWNNRRT